MQDIVLKMADVFKALGDTNRLKIIKLLASKMESRLCVEDLAKRLNITQPAASQHIRVLKNVGLLEPHKVGFYVFYNINIDVFTEYKENIDFLFKLAFESCPNFKSCQKD